MATEYKQWVDAFPYEKPRPAQSQLIETVRRRFQDQYDVVVVEAPTGVGKSGINTTIANLSPGKAFYTTPERKLRTQLMDDDSVQQHLTDLEARADYTCVPRSRERPSCKSCHVKGCEFCTEKSDVSECQEESRQYCESCSVNCKDCNINRSDNCSCADYKCPYYVRKHEAIDSQTALMTFSRLMYDSMMPTCRNGKRVSFGDRDLLIVDEAHELEPQTASLHLRRTINRRFFRMKPKGNEYNFDALTDSQRNNLLDENELIQSCYEDELTGFKFKVANGKDPLNFTKAECRRLYEKVKTNLTGEMNRLDSIRSQRKERLSRDTQEGWEVDEYYAALTHQYNQIDAKRTKLSNITSALAKETEDGNGDTILALETDRDCDDDEASTVFNWTPVYIGDRLQNDVWSRADRILLSTATVPNRLNPMEWLDRIGLTDDEYTRTVETVTSPFPIKNRPVYTGNFVAELNSYNWHKHVDALRGEIRNLSQDRHRGQKGLVHVSSYSKADDLHESLDDIAICHEDDDDTDDVKDKWQSGDKDVLISPSMRQGVDLPDDECRWQALAKVPWRPIQGRTDELKDREGESWYLDCAAREIIQASGRAVRHEDDWAVFHILDDLPNRLREHFPDWFSESVIRSEDKLDRWLDGR